MLACAGPFRSSASSCLRSFGRKRVAFGKGFGSHASPGAGSGPRRCAAFSSSADAPREKKNTYKKTLHLPKTKLGMRANAVVNEPKYSDRTTWQLYEWQAKLRTDDEAFTLHDGPPYANGSLHMGHFLNKVIKDALNRYHLLRGKRVRYVPGWDCHGMPIELKALQMNKKKQKNAPLAPTEIRALARSCAEDVVEEHKRDFVRWGIMADWEGGAGEGCYITMSHEYEARELDVLLGLHRQGRLYRGVKPVHWSPSSRTALAEAELEYIDDHKSRAVYVSFGIDAASCSGIDVADDVDLRALVWTTTPWTLPSNTALCVNPCVEYSIFQERGSNVAWIAATDLVDHVANDVLRLNHFDVTGRVFGEDLRGAAAAHPLCEQPGQITRPIICGDFVTTDAGTGVVHTAPSHGHDDANAWTADGGNLDDCPCPLDDGGCYVKDGFPRDMPDLAASVHGLSVLGKGNDKIVDALASCGALVHEETYIHRYPADWRTKQPTLIRATPQWFVSVNDIKAKCVEALEDVHFQPETGKTRLTAAVMNRAADWCVSRQRTWGVPIPAFYGPNSEVLFDERTIVHFRHLVSKRGTDCWYELSENELLPAEYKHLAAEGWKKGTDTLDVWFDSGCSWNAARIGSQADIYLEGSDQHRGWFQSSLLTRVGSCDDADALSPYKTLITHGYVLDGDGRKMSKSIGNVVGPNDIITQKQPPNSPFSPCGADALRMWACSSDYTADVWLSAESVKEAAEAVFRVRNCSRFLLGNMADYTPNANALDLSSAPYDDACIDVRCQQDAGYLLTPLDRHMLHLASELRNETAAAYARNDLVTVTKAIKAFVSADVSALYSDSIKDRMYSSQADAGARRGAQAVMFELLRTILVCVAPIAPHMAEEIFLHARKIGEFPHRADGEPFSVFQLCWEHPHDASWSAPEQLEADMESFLWLRSELRKFVAQSEDVTLQKARAQVRYNPSCKAARTLERIAGCGSELTTLTEILGVSQVSVIADDAVASEEGLELSVTLSDDDACKRCWRTSGELDETGICKRCHNAVIS